MTQRNPRRAILAFLRDVNRTMRVLVGIWDVRATIHEPITENNRVVNHTWRPRRPEEFPENQARKWRETSRALRGLAERMVSWADWCDGQAMHAEAQRVRREQ